MTHLTIAPPPPPPTQLPTLDMAQLLGLLDLPDDTRDLVRVRKGGKAAMGKEWQKGSPLSSIREHKGNIGVLTRSTPTFDIDIDDPDLAGQVRRFIEDALGKTLVRSRDGVPRTALLYRLADGEQPNPKQVVQTQTGNVEIHGDGQQLVVAGQYVQEDGTRSTLHLAGQIATVTAEEVRRMVEALRGRFGPSGEASGDTPPPPAAAASGDTPAAPAQPLSDSSERYARYARSALDQATGAVLAAPEGTRNDTLNRQAHGLYGLVKAGRLDYEAVTDALRKAALAAGLSEGETTATLFSALSAARPRHEGLGGVAAEPAASMAPISARELLSKGFNELHWNIEGILPAGTMLLFGKPKKGKSFLTMLVAVSVAAGRPVFGKASSKRPVLYLGLEDSERRLQRRLKGCANTLGISPGDFSDRLFIATSSKRIDTGLVADLHDWMKNQPDTGLIVVDMLKKVTGASTGRKSLYDEQGEVGDALTKFSHEFPELSIIVVHHARKMESDDPFDLVSGTTGLSGSYDNLAAISDVSGKRILYTTGRDIEPAEIPLQMNEGGMYTLEPVTAEDRRTLGMSDTRRAVYDAVLPGTATSRGAIIERTGLPESSADQMLRRLVEAGLLKKESRGRYERTNVRFYDEPIPDFINGNTGVH